MPAGPDFPAFSLAARARLRDTTCMSTAPQPVRIPEEEYLSTVYRPDCDYVDGEVLKRNLGTFDHSFIQGLLIRLFLNHSADWNCLALPEQRVRIRTGKYRILDVCVLRKPFPREQIVGRPALLFIEILSPEDRMNRMRERVDDYFALGTEHVSIIDPELRKAYVCSQRGFREPDSGVLTIPGTPIRVVLSELFAELDKA